MEQSTPVLKGFFKWHLYLWNQGDVSISQLSDFRPRSSPIEQVSLVDRYIDGSGRTRIKGNPNLKKSQSYPGPWFGLTSPAKVLVLFQEGYITKFFHHQKICVEKLKTLCPLGLGHTAAAPHPRFGKALAKLRSRHQKANRTKALKFIKQNVRSYRSIKRQTRKDALWVRCANLGPIFDFLA